MKTLWNYSDLATSYVNRPDYSSDAIDAMLAVAEMKPEDRVCDVGAGVGHLTIMLLERRLNVIAVEPNDQMREIGVGRTQSYDSVSWRVGTGESTNAEDGYFDFVSFGSSFNVCNRHEAMLEVRRILKPNKWFAVMWNHRELSDPIQSKIEEIIRSYIPTYSHGTRREDQTDIIKNSGLFTEPVKISSNVLHVQDVSECIDAWRSHATLKMQAGSNFESIVHSISKYLSSLNKNSIKIPYKTNIWMAKLVD